MSNIHTDVVVGVDGSVANAAAVTYAGDLATALGVQLQLVAAVTSGGSLPGGYASSPDEPGWSVLSDIAAEQRGRHPDLETRTRILFGEPAACLVDVTKEAQVAVVGKRGLGTFTRLMLGSISTAVAERAECPVIVVPQQWRTAEHPDADAVVVGSTAGGTADLDALRWAFTEAARTGSRLDVVHAIDLEPMLVWDPTLGAAAYREWEEGVAMRIADEIAPLRAEFPGVEARVLEQRGHAGTVLLDKSAEARLLVVGRHHRGPFGFGLGSVERAVLHHANVPVAVVPQSR